MHIRYEVKSHEAHVFKEFDVKADATALAETLDHAELITWVVHQYGGNSGIDYDAGNNTQTNASALDVWNGSVWKSVHIH